MRYKTTSEASKVAEQLSAQLAATGNRLSVIPVRFNVDVGNILLPESAAQAYALGYVLNSGPKSVLGLKQGDIVVYQFNKMFLSGIIHFVTADTTVMFVDERDCIGKVEGADSDMSTFTVLGEYLLMEVVRPDTFGGLVLPDTIEFKDSDKHVLIQTGQQVTDDDLCGAKVGSTVYIDKGRATPIRLNRRDHLFMNKMFLQGVALTAQ